MPSTIPSVVRGRLYRSETERDLILVGSPTWYDWLEHHHSFAFYDNVGGFYAHRKGTDPGDQYWEATRIQAGELKRIRLGQAHTLSLDWLQAAARTLIGERISTEATDESSTQPTLTPHQQQA